MASADWTELTGSLSGSSVERGVTAGIPRPPGGGSFVYGMNSLDLSDGAVGLFYNAVNFAPMAKGGSVRGAVKRGVSGGALNFAPMLFVCLGGATVNDTAYILGLEDADPHHLVLRKGSLITGVPSSPVSAPPTQGVLRKSSVGYAIDTWLHLRLDAVVNLNGDVVLNVFANDLTVMGADVSTPTWAAVPGMDRFIDDTLQVNTGSAPLTSGRAGFAGRTKDVTRRMFWDHAEIIRQL